jgi:hypothetical protein
VTIGVVAWTVGAGTAVFVGVLALSMIGAGATDVAVSPLLPEAIGDTAPDPAGDAATDSVEPSPAVSASASAKPRPTARPITTAAPAVGNQRLLASSGGTVVARCLSNGAYLLYWSPAQGFHAEGVSRGPNETARLVFDNDDRWVRVTVSCDKGVPQATIHEGGKADDD